MHSFDVAAHFAAGFIFYWMGAMAILSHTLGFPRIGAQRELKFALEAFWRNETTEAELTAVAANLRQQNWQAQLDSGLDFVTVGDFALYDHIANHIQLLGCEPARFGFAPEQSRLNRYFTMARGGQSAPTAKDATDKAAHNGASQCAQTCSHVAPAHAQAALEMTKWFDTNYHYLVPEFSPNTEFKLDAAPLLAEVAQAQQQLATAQSDKAIKVVLVGPLSFLWLGKEKQTAFERLALLPKLLPIYAQLLAALKAQGVQWVQMDEPILGLDLPDAWRHAFEPTYWQLSNGAPSLLLATYFSPLQENLRMACQLPVAGLHVDAVRAPAELVGVADWLPSHKVLSLGLIDGRNIWRTDLDAALATLQPVMDKHGGAVWLAPSCSLLHVPYSLQSENGTLKSEIKNWLAFAVEKLKELQLLKQLARTASAPNQALSEAEQLAMLESRQACAARRNSSYVQRADVAQRLQAANAQDGQRKTPFKARQLAQKKRWNLPLLPTTTIGSFPQTTAIRGARAAFKRGQLSASDYREAMAAEILNAVRMQESIGLDVLVHGEAERNDMVEYFGEQLDGFAFSSHGWVQSYGSRCVKPPIIYGDVARSAAMTVDWTTYAQSLTERPMKGMLTGPITMLQWSFVRDDQPRNQTMLQIAYALRDEVCDLESAGIGIIQIDEPAIREGLPLRRSGWQPYLDAATLAFRVCASGVADDTQIHTHMCYSEFNDILPDIAAMDADVITIETSRSDMELLHGFGAFKYPNEIGPGVYDIHSPRIPNIQEMRALLDKAVQVIPVANLWVNPDCGLKTRNWEETERALRNMVSAAAQLRAEKDTLPTFI